jgi:hypothetical protein
MNTRSDLEYTMHSSCATGVSSGLATVLTLTLVLGLRLRESVAWRWTYFWFCFCTALRGCVLSEMHPVETFYNLFYFVHFRFSNTNQPVNAFDENNIMQKFIIILLHVWGSLGFITLALLQQWDSITMGYYIVALPQLRNNTWRPKRHWRTTM